MKPHGIYSDAGGEKVISGGQYWVRFGPLNEVSQSYIVIAAIVTAIDPSHRRGGPIKISYRTPGALAANRTGWRQPEQLYRHRLEAAFVSMPSENPLGDPPA